MTLRLQWNFSNRPFADFGCAITGTIGQIAREHLSDLAEMFPFRNSIVESNGYLGNGWFACRVSDLHSSGIPRFGNLNEAEISELSRKVLPFYPRGYMEYYKLLGSDWYSTDKFTYIGPYNDSPPSACWPHVFEHLSDWLTHLVIPDILRKNQMRVLRAVPGPPQFSIDEILKSLWVLECEKTFRQGTAFWLNGVGLVTCQHVLGTQTMAFKSSEPTQKYPVGIIRKNSTIDLAVLRIEPKENPVGLPIGTADEVNQMDHIAIAGFPNYRIGDSGIFIPGIVTGFRMVSGIRRILTNAPIVSGNSGGPVVGRNNQVIGVAVTGVDRMEEAQDTENHGIIPIDALNHIT